MLGRLDNCFVFRFFDKKEYLDEFIYGSIRTMSIQYYKELESDPNLPYNKSDPFENSLYIENLNNGKPIPSNNPVIVKSNYGDIHLMNSIVDLVNICDPTLDFNTKILCLTVIKLNEIKNHSFSSVFNEIGHNLGNYYCLITDTDVFLKMISNVMDELEPKNIIRNFEYNFVDYKDQNSLCGSYSAFKKRVGFRWQREFRIKYETPNNDPCYIKIPSLQYITDSGTVDEIMNAKVDDYGYIETGHKSIFNIHNFSKKNDERLKEIR